MACHAVVTAPHDCAPLVCRGCGDDFDSALDTITSADRLLGSYWHTRCLQTVERMLSRGFGAVEAV